MRTASAVRLASLAGETSILLGWITQDQGDHGSAQRFYLSALDAADQAGDRALGAYAIGSASTLPAFRSSPADSIHLLTEASIKGSTVDGATPSIRAWIYTLEAEAHSRNRSLAEAMGALDAGDAALAMRGDEPELRPRAEFFDAHRLTAERGITAVKLGQPDDAVEALEAASADLDDESKIQSRILTNLARARIAQGEIDEACAIAIRSLDVAEQTATDMSLSDLVTFRQELDPWADHAAVQDLTGRLLAHTV